MKALILAAGRGSRMKSMTENNPKGLVRLQNKALVDYQIGALRGGGIDKVGIITGYLAEHYQSRADEIFHNANWQNTNMVASLRCASPWLKAEPSCIISYSDIVYTAPAVKALAGTPGDIVIVYDPNWRTLWKARFTDPLDDCETFVCDANGKLLDIGKKPRTLDEVKGQYTGLFKITPAGWPVIENLLLSKGDAAVAKMDMTGMLNTLLEEGISIMCCPMQGDWGEVDEATDLELYNNWMADGKMNLAG